MNGRSFDKVADYLLPDHFSDSVNGRIYEVIAKLVGQGKIANLVTLRAELDHDDLVKEAGGTRYIASLLAGAVTIINAEQYGHLIYDMFLRREMIAIAEDVTNDCYASGPSDSSMDIIEVAESRMFGLTMKDNTRGFKDVATAAHNAVVTAEAAYRREGKLVGVDTGLADLNKRLGGLHNQDLIILAGRPSMGKTALATTIAYNAAKRASENQSGSVAFFSLEMSAEQVTNRILSHLTGISVHSIRNGDIALHDINLLMDAAKELESIPLRMDDAYGLSVPQIRSRCRRQARSKKGLGLIVLDYIQLVTPTRIGREENRTQEVSAITRGLKQLAREFNVPVLALSQLSRAIDNREDKRPMLSDLRESGTIEQDADVVQFVYREEYYLERSEPVRRGEENDERYISRRTDWSKRMEAAKNVVDVITGKQRQGPVGTDRCHFEPQTTWVTDLHPGLVKSDFRLL